MAAARRVPVLFLDDFGKEHGNADWLEELWFVLIDHRYPQNLTTVITTQEAGAKLAAKVGAAVVTRLTHGAWVATIRKPATPYRQPEVTT
jgi:DNA replication protein DnaC